MAMVEHLEGKVDLEVLTEKMRKHPPYYDIPIHTYNEIFEICQDLNALSLTDMEKLDKDSLKKFFERLDEISE